MVTVRAPATSANLGSGFDVFGLALSRPVDEITVTRAETTTIEVTGAGAEFVPTDPAENTAGVVAAALDAPAHIHIDKGVRPASGLGSSAASAAAAAVALDALYGRGYSRRELVRVAAEGEAAVAGEAHADNVAPAILGGFTGTTPSSIVATQAPVGLEVVVALPAQIISTADAREVVPASVSLPELTTTVGAAATLCGGMYQADPALIGAGLVDGPTTRARAELIDGYEAAVAAAERAGALGVTVSGAGPAVLAIPEVGKSQPVAAAVVEGFAECDVEARALPVEIGYGAEIE
ncbi:MAG: homoserine kinase [Halobacteriaceae archaeon]